MATVLVVDAMVMQLCVLGCVPSELAVAWLFSVHYSQTALRFERCVRAVFFGVVRRWFAM